MDLEGSVAIVTGGNGALGREVGRALAGAGAHVAVVYARSQEAAEDVARELSALGPRALAVRADVADENAVKAMVERVLAEFGRVDTLVNNAAFNKWVPYQDLDSLTLDLWQKIIGVNATGPFLCCKAVAPTMRRQERGRIVNIASVAGFHPIGSSIAYSVSKAALVHLTKCMAVALAPHVLVNCVAPGTMEGTRATANLDPEYAEKARRSALTGRFTDKADVAAQVLAFIRSDSTTGQAIVVDGGRVFH
ncbi:MAG: SDR family NAD(P)-dependent oxidoreductase [Chloroflexota bacterium]